MKERKEGKERKGKERRKEEGGKKEIPIVTRVLSERSHTKETAINLFAIIC